MSQKMSQKMYQKMSQKMSQKFNKNRLTFFVGVTTTKNNEKELNMHEQMMKDLGPGGGKEDEGEEEGSDFEDERHDGDAQEQEWKGLECKTLCPEEERVTAETFSAFWEKLQAGIIIFNTNRSSFGVSFFFFFLGGGVFFFFFFFFWGG